MTSVTQPIQSNERALQAAEEPDEEGFVKGHDFSRANKLNQINWALAPEHRFPQLSLQFLPFPQPVEPLAFPGFPLTHLCQQSFCRIQTYMAEESSHLSAA